MAANTLGVDTNQSLAPEIEPACRRYDVAAQVPADASHVKTTVEPVTDARRFAGAFGTVPQLPTTNTTSVDGALSTPAAALSRRM